LGLGAVLGFASVFGPLACLDVPIGLGAASAFHGKTLLPSGFVGNPLIATFQRSQNLPIKEAQIGHKMAKEE
jgi:hypothetical protein